MGVEFGLSCLTTWPRPVHQQRQGRPRRFIGDAEAQAGHEARMLQADGDGHGGHGDDAEDAITVEPGATSEFTYAFDEAGPLLFGCHQPTHYDAGMKTTVEVA